MADQGSLLFYTLCRLLPDSRVGNFEITGAIDGTSRQLGCGFAHFHIEMIDVSGSRPPYPPQADIPAVFLIVLDGSTSNEIRASSIASAGF